MVAGETDIEQLGRVITTFGSVEDAWPGVKELPDYGKISFAASLGYPLEELLPDASPGSVNLLKRLLKLDPGKCCWYWPTAIQLIRHKIAFVTIKRQLNTGWQLALAAEDRGLLRLGPCRSFQPLDRIACCSHTVSWC